MSGYVGRLAPSPTGALHLGNVRTFMVAWLRARSLGGKVILRTEDLDHPRDRPGAAGEAIADLRWLGFDWDCEYVQSRRREHYREALAALCAGGEPLAYPCVCSRRDVEAAQSAPHAGEQLHYPGTCRGRFADWRAAAEHKLQAGAPAGSPPCWRFRTPDAAAVGFDDVFAGCFRQDVPRALGDFPLARDEFGAGYTLACAVDDLLMGVTEVVRGDDLLPATPAQLLVMEALRARSPRFAGLRTPDYLHVPLVVGRDGKRLAKRHGDTRISTFRAAGKAPEEIVGMLAASCGWARPGEAAALPDLLGRFRLDTIPRHPFMV